MKSAVSDDFTKSIDEAVHKVREHKDIKGRYMTLQEKFDDEKVAGIREGIETGKAEGESSKAKADLYESYEKMSGY